MYKIIGADQREYGPVNADQIRQWIIEGRANGATLVQPEGESGWQALSNFADFADALRAQAAAFPGAATAGTTPPAQALDPLARPAMGQSLDIANCVVRSWKLFQVNFGVLIAGTLIFLVVIGGLNQLIAMYTRSMVESLMAGNVSLAPILLIMLWNIPEMALTAILSGGLYQLMLNLMRGRPAGIGDVFSGFTTSLPQLALAGVVVQLLTVLGLLACVVPGIYLSVAWIFTVPLIADRGLGFWAAMELSRKTVTKQWWMVFCLLIVVALISLAGFLACCIGLAASLPIAFGVLLYAYEDIFGGPGSTSY